MRWRKQQRVQSSVRTTRRLLRDLRRIGRLERDPVGLALRDALGAATVRDALLDVIERALQHEVTMCRAIVERCDVRGDSTAEAAAELGLSLRSLFRYRRRANEAIATAIARALSSGARHESGSFEAR
jgi:DNA-directed RNA polymerase specialized sigma24 family protein